MIVWSFIVKLADLNSPLLKLGFMDVLFSYSLEQKSLNYLINNPVDEIFISKIRIELANNKKKMYISNYVWSQTFFGHSTSILLGHVSTF